MTKPFFKWPGAKTWLVAELADVFSFKGARVVEPFAGSASFFLGSGSETALLTDNNQHVATCLQAVRDNPDAVVARLARMSNEKNYYDTVRDQRPRSATGIAARLIFLTNTSWGGIYRENAQGRFNVPFGNNEREFCDPARIRRASQRLKNVEIGHRSYEVALEAAKATDILFVDPPYVSHVSRSGFNRYSAALYTWQDQMKLVKILTGKRLRGARTLVASAAALEIYQLFPGWHAVEFNKRKSMLTNRGEHGHRKEALLLSPALGALAANLALHGHKIRRCS